LPHSVLFRVHIHQVNIFGTTSVKFHDFFQTFQHPGGITEFFRAPKMDTSNFGTIKHLSAFMRTLNYAKIEMHIMPVQYTVIMLYENDK